MSEGVSDGREEGFFTKLLFSWHLVRCFKWRIPHLTDRLHSEWPHVSYIRSKNGFYGYSSKKLSGGEIWELYYIWWKYKYIRPVTKSHEISRNLFWSTVRSIGILFFLFLKRTMWKHVYSWWIKSPRRGLKNDVIRTSDIKFFVRTSRALSIKPDMYILYDEKW